MHLDPAGCYRALAARDARFDGAFFVGVRTTGIYCRPICPARTPGRDRCQFFERAAQAERAGYRACFRCRPELAPGLATVDSAPRLVRAAARHIDAGFLDEHSTDELAARLGVSSRHLRRTLESELGASPIALAQSRRLALAKQLLHDSALPLADVAFAAGFSSVRRYNDLFRRTFGCAPSAFRRQHGAAGAGLRLRLDYRAPFDWESLLAFLEARAIPGVEAVAAGEYRRAATIDGHDGWISVKRAARPGSLVADIALSLAPVLSSVVPRLRALFDLDAVPHLIEDHLRRDRTLADAVRRRPGLRVPGAFDGFEMVVRAVLGQQVSVRGATTLAGRLALRLGREAPSNPVGLSRVFPDAAAVARAPARDLEAIGLPCSRARCITAVARAVAEGRLDVSGGGDPETALAALVEVPGIGPWTAHYVAMRALRWPDAFPGGDLGVRKALGVTTTREASERARAWSPWRAYGVMHLWRSLSEGARR